MSPHEIHRLHDDMCEAMADLRDEWVQEFPKGERITWLFKGQYRQYGVVTYVNDFPTETPWLYAENERTGRQATVYLWMQPERA